MQSTHFFRGAKKSDVHSLKAIKRKEKERKQGPRERERERQRKKESEKENKEQTFREISSSRLCGPQNLQKKGESENLMTKSFMCCVRIVFLVLNIFITSFSRIIHVHKRIGIFH